jgi:hypothetical protein
MDSAADKLDGMAERNEHDKAAIERQKVIFEQLDKLTSRARLLQRCVVTFYLSLGTFVATSVALGVVAFTGNPRHNLVPICDRDWRTTQALCSLQTP